MIHLVPDNTAAALVKYDPEVQVIDVSLTRRIPRSPSSVWVVYGLFMDYELDGRVVHVETMVPAAILELSPLVAPSPTPGLFALFVDTPDTAPQEILVYDQPQKLLCIRFRKADPTTTCHRLGDRLLIETQGGSLAAVWLTDLNLVVPALNAS